MRLAVLAALVLLFGACFPARGQSSQPIDLSTQFHRNWELGRTVDDLEKRDGAIEDPRILPYLQRLADRIGSSAGVAPIKMRLTRSSAQYAAVLPNRTLYISAGMLARIDDEAELAGLMAHQIGHLVLQRRGLFADGACVLDPHAPTFSADMRERERQAIVLAISNLKGLGYDPTSMLSLLSKLAYEHPAWSKALASEDLLELRAVLENGPSPTGRYQVDSSAFVEAHGALLSMFPKMAPPVLRARQ